MKRYILFLRDSQYKQITLLFMAYLNTINRSWQAGCSLVFLDFFGIQAYVIYCWMIKPGKVVKERRPIFCSTFFLVWLGMLVCVNVPWEVRIIPVTVFVHNHGELWIKSLKAKKLLFCFRLRHWLSKMIAVPMQQSDAETEHFYSQSVPSKQTIVAMSTTMASFASMLWEWKWSVSISVCFVVCPWLWQFQWANQKWKQSFYACREMTQSLPLLGLLEFMLPVN